jgi:hypothetical protein
VKQPTPEKATNISHSSSRSNSSGSVENNINTSKTESFLSSRDEEDSDEVILEEIHRRLGKCRCKWLFVFDNLEDPSLVRAFLPRGRGIGFASLSGSSSSASLVGSPGQYRPIQAGIIADRPISEAQLTSFTSSSPQVSGSISSGHVLITSRIMHELWSERGSTIVLDCFDDQESIRFLEISLGGNADMGDSLDYLEGLSVGPTKESEVYLSCIQPLYTPKKNKKNSFNIISSRKFLF